MGKADQNIAHLGEVSLDLEKANQIKKLIFVSAAFQKIKISYRFMLISCEILYQNKHIKTMKLAGLYLSGIDLVKVEAQLSAWRTVPSPETFLDGDEIVMSEEFGEQCYFVAHRSGEEFYVA